VEWYHVKLFSGVLRVTRMYRPRGILVLYCCFFYYLARGFSPCLLPLHFLEDRVNILYSTKLPRVNILYSTKLPIGLHYCDCPPPRVYLEPQTFPMERNASPLHIHQAQMNEFCVNMACQRAASPQGTSYAKLALPYHQSIRFTPSYHHQLRRRRRRQERRQ
jgi:hypothetical protein